MYFSPNDPFEVFETQILLLEESLSGARGRILIAGDFNSKLPEWREDHLDRRGILIGEMVVKNDLTVLNTHWEMTFRHGSGESIIDLAIAAPRLTSKIGDWYVLGVCTLSDHRYIEFRILKRSHPVYTGRGGKRRNPSWNTR